MQKYRITKRNRWSNEIKIEIKIGIKIKIKKIEIKIGKWRR